MDAPKINFTARGRIFQRFKCENITKNLAFDLTLAQYPVSTKPPGNRRQRLDYIENAEPRQQINCRIIQRKSKKVQMGEYLSVIKITQPQLANCCHDTIIVIKS
jgi:hypothetical protein